MRILRGYIGCWLGLVVSLFLTVFSYALVGNPLPHLAAAALPVAFVPTIVFGLFEKPTWGPVSYLAVGTALGVCALACLIVATGPLPRLNDAEQLVQLLIGIGGAVFVGATTGGAYRLLAGAKEG